MYIYAFDEQDHAPTVAAIIKSTNCCKSTFLKSSN